MYLLRMPRWARMEAGQIKGHQFSIVASRINISRTVPSSLYVTQRIPSMIAKNQVFSTNFFHTPHFLEQVKTGKCQMFYDFICQYFAPFQTP